MADTHTATFDSLRFRQVLGNYPTGVTIVTALVDDAPVGLAVGSFTSLSLDPPLVLFCATKTSTSWPKVRDAGRFCVNVLADDQQAVCRTFAQSGGDKFAEISWRRGPSGAPVIDGVLAWLDCEIDQVLEAGDHYIVTGRVDDLSVERETGPLLFFRGGYGQYSQLSE